jgi:hypothetical protein
MTRDEMTGDEITRKEMTGDQITRSRKNHESENRNFVYWILRSCKSLTVSAILNLNSQLFEIFVDNIYLKSRSNFKVGGVFTQYFHFC